MAGRFHNCPVSGCPKQLPAHLAFCAQHWFMVPNDLQRRIWRLFDTQAGSIEHRRAIREAARVVDAKLASDRPQKSAVSQAKEDLEAIKRRQRVLRLRDE